MATVIPPVLLFLLLLLANFATSDTTFIAKSCSTTKFPDLCMKTLQTEPSASQCTIPICLARVSIVASRFLAEATTHDVDNLLGQNPSPDTRAALEKCRSEYTAVVDGLNRALAVFDEKRYEDAADAVADEVYGVQELCDKAFPTHPNVMSLVNERVVDVLEIAIEFSTKLEN